jgi:hypothetical protein
MTSKFIWALVAAPLFALSISPASACKVVGKSASGEPLCMTTSDGGGQPYKPDNRPIFVPDNRPIFVPNKVPKAVQAMEIWKQRHSAPKALQAMHIAQQRKVFGFLKQRRSSHHFWR